MVYQAVCSKHALLNEPGFLQTFSICPSLCLWFPNASKINHCAHTKEKLNHMLERLEARSDPHLQQVL